MYSIKRIIRRRLVESSSHLLVSQQCNELFHHHVIEQKKTPVVVLCDSSSSLRLVPYDESAHLDAYDAFMRDPQMLLDTKTEATTKDTWRAILSNNQTIESGVEQFMIDVLGDDGKRTCIGDVSSHDVPSCDVEEDEDDDEEEEEEEEGAVSKEISICIFDKRYQRRGYARAAVKLFVTFVEHRCDEWYDAMEDKTKTTTTSVKPRSFLAKIDRKNTASMALFRDRLGFECTAKQRARNECEFGREDELAPNYFGEIELGLKTGTTKYGTMTYTKQTNGVILGEMQHWAD